MREFSRRKFGNGFYNGCNGSQEEGRRKKEERRGNNISVTV